MEREEDNVSGTYYKLSQKHNGRNVIPLFFSKREAIDFLNECEEADNFAIRGVPQHYLKRLIGFGEIFNLMFFLMLPCMTKERVEGLYIGAAELKNRYLLSEISSDKYKEFYVERKSPYNNELTLFKILKAMKSSIEEKLAGKILKKKK